MMDIPPPALLAAIMLLLWPAGRLCAVYGGTARIFFPARMQLKSALSMKLRALEAKGGAIQKLHEVELQAAVLIGHSVLLGAILGASWLLKSEFERIFGQNEPLSFGVAPASAFFELAMLSQFAVFVFLAAFDSKRIVSEKRSVLGTDESAGGIKARPLMSTISILSERLRIDVTLYASTAVVLAIIFVVGTGLSAHSN